LTSRTIFVTGAVLTGLAVAIGAFGAHGLKSHTDAAGLAIWETGVRYQVLHGLALLILALAADRFSGRMAKVIYWCFLAGALIFSVSLYVLVLSGVKWLGAITPIGGVLMLVGWAIMALAYQKARRQ
jgi:uncharacterized membrane protein YgdD (TMEM256/DUF423 family)